MVMPCQGEASQALGHAFVPRSGRGSRGAPARRVVAQALQRPLRQDRRRRRREHREHPPRGRLHRLRGGDPAAQPHPRSVLRPGPALPGAGPARLQARDGPRPLALPGAARQEARAERRPAGALQGRRRAQPAPAREQHRLRCHHGQLVRLLLQQAGRREGPDRGRQDPAPQRPARARHHRRRPHARELRQALVGVDRRAPLRVPRAHHQPGRRAADLARGDRARRDGRDRRPVLCRAALYARKHRQAAGEDRLPQRAPPRPRRGAVRPRPGSRHDGAPHPADRPTPRSCRCARAGASCRRSTSPC